MKTGIELIAEERNRQIKVKGFTAAHDDKHEGGEMIRAGLSYVMIADGQGKGIRFPACFFPRMWPWERRWWKPSGDPVENLAKAGALIAAEIDRLQRKRNRKN
ncbi:hypothetical protein OpiT1DRAFT_00183 [Opitutaceae bacterium TAV1]|nr:hypothetical protein OpiT1DRAFT_00183 [Opitutaceae bacterium TAV1]